MSRKLDRRIKMSVSEPAAKKSLARVVVVTLASSVVFLIAVLQLGRFLAAHSAETAIPWLVVITGVVLTVVVVVAMRSLGRMDELERKMHSESMAFAFLCSVLIISAYIFVTAAGLETPPVHWLLPAMMSCWAIGVLLAYLRYR
jgi:hypothetical protein